MIKFVDYLHERFIDPVTIRGAASMPPSMTGLSIEMSPESLEAYRFGSA